MTIRRVGTCFDDVLKLLPIHVSRECDAVLLESGFRQRVSISIFAIVDQQLEDLFH
jgi:hypothetical protein